MLVDVTEFIVGDDLFEFAISQGKENCCKGIWTTRPYLLCRDLGPPRSLEEPQSKYKGSSYNVLVDWDDKTQTWEPLDTMAEQDPVTLARYAHDNGLLNEPGWKFLRHIDKRQRFLIAIINSVKRHTNPNQVKYKFGVCVPRTFAEAMMLDKDNGNTFWGDAVHCELDQLFSDKTFHDLGPGGLPGMEYKKIKIRFVFDVKADGRRKGRLVARGDMTPEPNEAVYSSVSTLCSLRIVIFLAELNGLNLMQGDVGNAYLESYTQEKVYFIAGPEFGHHAGTTFIIEKALYGLRLSGLRFHKHLSNVLQGFDFTWSHVDPDVWMRDTGDTWEYIMVYVDDIIVAMKDPKSFFDELQDPDKVGFKMKGVGSPTYHLGADFFRDDDGTLCLGSQTYAKHLCSNFERLYGEAPKSVFSPLDHDDHPELNDSPFCGPEDTSKFQSLIGACQWMISLYHMDIAQAIMSLSRFRHCPCQGHVDRLKQVCGYICKFPKWPLDFMSESQTMNPFSVPNRPSMIGWKWYTGHPPKIHPLMH